LLRARHIALAFVAVVTSLAVPNAASAADLVVNDDATGAGPANADCVSPAFAAIQPAINSASAVDRILVCEGTYVGQLDVNTAIEVLGAGDGSVVRSPNQPAVVSRYSVPGFEIQPVVWANADGVAIRNLQIDGNRQGYENGTKLFVGIGALNRSGLVVEGSKITKIQKTPFDGVQTGFGIRVDNTDNALAHGLDRRQPHRRVPEGRNRRARRRRLDHPQTDIAQNGNRMGRGMSVATRTRGRLAEESSPPPTCWGVQLRPENPRGRLGPA